MAVKDLMSVFAMPLVYEPIIENISSTTSRHLVYQKCGKKSEKLTA